MGKKRIIQKSDLTTEEGRASAIRTNLPKRKMAEGVVHVQSTYNNTIISISDTAGAVVFAATAATKVAEFLGEKAKAIGVQKLGILVKGVGGGRESAVRSFIAQGFEVGSIRDITPIPHNGPRPPKPRRV